MAATRAKVILLMRAAIRQGQSRTAFLKTIRAKGLQYPQKRMYADWANTSEFIAKTGALVHVQRDAYPAKKTVIETDWDIDGEWMYTVKVKSRLRPSEPITERKVNIVTNTPMTPRMIEQAVIEKWSAYEDYSKEALTEITPWTAIHTNI